MNKIQGQPAAISVDDLEKPSDCDEKPKPVLVQS